MRLLTLALINTIALTLSSCAAGYYNHSAISANYCRGGGVTLTCEFGN